MTKRVLFLVLLGLLVSVATEASDCDVEAYFVSPAVDGVIREQIISAIDAAQESILIAMYSFTDAAIGDAVIAAKQRGVDVSVLLDDGQDSGAQGRQYPKLIGAGIRVGVEHLSGLLHDKFAVIDDVLVITGSYNWTNSADGANFENVVFVTCAEIAGEYAAQFAYIADDILELGWGLPAPPPPAGGECAGCLARLNSATEAEFAAVSGIGETLSGRLVAGQPYVVSDCTRRAILAELEGVEGVGPVKAEAILDHFCPGMK